MSTQPESQTRLHGKWLLIARLAWMAGFITLTTMYALGFLAVRDALSTVCQEERCTLKQQIRHTEAGDQVVSWPGPPIGYADRLRPDQVVALEKLGLTLSQYGWLGALQMGIPVLMYLVTAAGLFWRKSDDWMVLFVSMMVATFPLQDMPLPFTLMVRQPAWEWVLFPASWVAVSSLLIFPLIFPSGRFVPRWTKWIVWLDIVFGLVAWLFRDSLIGIPAPANLLFLVCLVILFIAGVYAQLYRYFRVAGPVERQQLKWVIVGLVGFISIAVAVLLPLNASLNSQVGSMDPARALGLSAVLDTLFRAISLFVPFAIAISVLRYRLWDIDLIISRTLVYGSLSAGIVVLYIVLVGALSVLSQTTGNLLISLLATGLIAFLFQPLRERLQRGINHLLYGDRDEPYAALARLGRRLEASLAPEAVLPTIVTTVRDALKLPYVAIYIKHEDGIKIVAESASPSLHSENGRIRVPGMERAGQCIPLIHQGETLGYVVVGPRAPNEGFSTTDRRLLDDLAPQVGAALHAVRLTADLQRSREQLVLAREEERRRLRLDLHDGLGPQLASLGLKLETARNRMTDDPPAAALLDDLSLRTQQAVADIRRLVYALRPRALDELGLVMALREVATQYDRQGTNGVNITFDAPASLPPLAAAVEVAAYRIAQEALTNVVRHAQARYCLVRLNLDEQAGILCLEVRDDGKGLSATRHAGIGLNSMRERAEELGGTLSIMPASDGGTSVLAHLPCTPNEASKRDDREMSFLSQEEL